LVHRRDNPSKRNEMQEELAIRIEDERATKKKKAIDSRRVVNFMEEFEKSISQLVGLK
jgi:hypothetical protein